jgi:23S rRNA (uracil1939-C5)-methyltransferase
VIDGERVEASLIEEKPGFARAKLDRIIESSPARTIAECPYFQSCGGCHYQHMDYARQLANKKAILEENLRRITKIEVPTEIEIHAGPEFHYRNRTRLRVQSEPAFALGYNRMNSHQFLPVEQCPISSPLINRAIGQILEVGRAGRLTPGVNEIELFADSADETLIAELYLNEGQVSIGESWWRELEQVLPELKGAAAFVVSRDSRIPEKTVARFGTGELVYKTADAQYRVSAGSFFQVNRFLTDRLIKIVTEGRNGGTALDLYAGVGLFSSVLNREFERVIAVEASPISYQDLLYNSPANVKAVRATTEEYLKNAGSKLRPDLVVVDPPRSGLGPKVVASLTRMHAANVIYVSCDPATLCRDLRGFLQAGYKMKAAHMLDLFPQTFHLESVFHLVR